MPPDSNKPTMDQRIFRMNLDVEAVSLYLLLCGLADAGATLSLKNVEPSWTGTPEDLAMAFESLERRRVLKKILSDEENAVFRIQDPGEWVKE
ncbi:MAG: hypothetical protein JRI97_03735 [Deltaproteobacteria bacterium]|nr:hypothetical protein [Deltaproteobacteria bacterium]